MKKTLSIAILAILFLAPLLYGTPHGVYGQEDIGIENFVRHDWAFTRISIDLTVYDSTGETSEAMNYTDDLINQLEGAEITFILGKVHPTDKIVYVVPFLTITQDFTVYSYILKDLLNISQSEAEELEFTIPRGSAIIIATGAEFIASPYSLLFEAAGEMVTTQYPSFFIVSVPYPYGEVPAPPSLMVDPAMLSSHGSAWEGYSGRIEGITTDYSESANKAIFTASGTNETEYSDEDYYIYTFLNVITFRAEYSLDTGILQLFEINIEAEYNYTYYDYWYDEWVKTGIELTINIRLEHVGAKAVEIGLEDGEKIGFKVTTFEVSPELIDAINQTLIEQGYPPLTEENVTFFMNQIRGLTAEFEYIEPNPYIDSGLDLFFNVTVATPDIPPSSTEIMSNALVLGSPYVLPEWDLLFGDFQFWMHFELKVLPKFVSFYFEREDPNIIFEVDGDYAVLSRDDNAYVSAYTTINAHLGYTTTIPDEDKVKFDLTLDIERWHTYTGDGYLTEYAIKINGTLLVDTDMDNSLTDETPITGYIELVINRVETDPTTNEVDWEAPIDSPDPAEAGWTDVTPYRVTIPERPPFVLPVPLEYVAIGVAVIVIIAIIALARRR